MKTPLGASAAAFLAAFLLSRLPQDGWRLAVLVAILVVVGGATILELVVRRTWQRRSATLGILVFLAWPRPEDAIVQVAPVVVALTGLAFLHFLYSQQGPPELGVRRLQVGRAILACLAVALVLAPLAASALPWVWGALAWGDLRELHIGGISLYLGALLLVSLAVVGVVASLRSPGINEVKQE